MNEKNAALMLEAALARLLEASDPRDAIAAAPVEIRPYVQLVADLRAEAIPPPSEAFRNALRARLLGHMRSQLPRTNTVTPRLQRVTAAGVAALAFGSALQPALARELVHHLRLTLGETVANLVQSALNEVAPPDDADLTGGTGSVEPTSGQSPITPSVAPTPVDAVQGGQIAMQRPASHRTASERRETEPNPQDPRTLTATSEGPPAPASSRADRGVGDEPGVAGMPPTQAATPGSGAPTVTQSGPSAPNSTGQTTQPQPVPGPHGAGLAGEPIASEDTGATTEPATPGTVAPPANDPPGPAGPSPQDANGGNRGNAPVHAAKSGNKLGWENKGSDGPPGNSPAVPPGQAKTLAGDSSTDTPGNSPAVPPGQAKSPAGDSSTDTPGNSPAVSPGKAKAPADDSSAETPGNSPAVPPGQASDSDTGKPPNTPGTGPKK